MNVGIFNRVNLKGSSSSDMYSEWSSLPLEGGGTGVLGAIGGKDVVIAVIKQIASPEPSPLNTDSEVEWVLEVIRYGLSLPLSEHEAVRDCVRVCCVWLSPLLSAPPAPAHPPAPALPPPVARSPRRYARLILRHLHNLFVPRTNESSDLISKQAVLCHRVLRLARSLAGSGELGASEWRSLLLLLLAAASALLSPPVPHHSAAEQLCERVLCVLFEVWILACHRCFPSPPLWRTLREQCLRWRHRPALTDQWTRASLCLTARLLTHMYGDSFPAMPINEEDANLVPCDMSAEAVMQTWYRILHTIGNPVDLCRPNVISQTPDFLQYSITQEEGANDPNHYACLKELPAIFLKAMKGIAAHVDAFLGRGAAGRGEDPTHTKETVTKRLAHDKDKGVSKSSLINLTGSRPFNVPPTTPPNSISSHVETEKPPLAPLRPKVNSIFHLFGEWLFEAALIGTPLTQNTQQQRNDGTTPPPPTPEAIQKINMMSYQPGRAEALGTLCRVLCSKQCRELVLAPYLVRCYAALRYGLKDPNTAAAVVLNAYDIFRLDLDGVLVLVPDFLSALERVLPEREPRLECGPIDKRELRKAAISALLSLVAFPHHYVGLPVPEFPGCNDFAGVTLGDMMRGRVSMLCISAVQAETAAPLCVSLLTALYLCVLHSHTQVSSHPATACGRSDTSAATPDLDCPELDPNDPGFGTALVVRATYLVCHRLISSWNLDLQVSLAALELLSGLAKLHSAKPDALERKRAVRWICDYISEQCSRPPPAHSRDLHSCVVGAYSCLSSWLCPALLHDPVSAATLMEVVELGLSGTKSTGKPGEPAKMKDEKELKPVSMRVRDAAESLLMLILDEAGRNKYGCRLDERWLSSLGHGPLRHFVVDGSLLLSLLEEPLANSEEPQPTLIVLIRGWWGRCAWSVRWRGAARSAGREARSPAVRPVDITDPRPSPRPHCHPLHHAPHPHLDAAFPSLEDILRKLNDPEAQTFFKLLEQQAAIEKRVRETESNCTPEEYVPPEPVTEFQTARLFLSHFGFLNIGGDKKSGPPRLVALDSSLPGFSSALRRVDACGPRVAVTVHVFCVTVGQTTAREIASNGRCLDTLPDSYVKLLNGLGEAVSVRGHPGWSGHVSSSYDAPHTSTPPTDTPHGPYDGTEHVLYWSDASSEIAFVVPSDTNHLGDRDSVASDVDGSCFSRSAEKTAGESSWDVSSGSNVYERSVSESGERRPTLDKTRTMSLELDNHPPGFTGSGRRNREYAPKFLIVWFEDFEDHLNLPIDELLTYCDTGICCRRGDVVTVYLSGRRSGLVEVRGGSGVLHGPLAEGALLAPHALPDSLRRAALHATNHHTDIYQPPHVRRRHLIQELTQQYKKDLTEPELLESLFKPPM